MNNIKNGKYHSYFAYYMLQSKFRGYLRIMEIIFLEESPLGDSDL